MATEIRLKHPGTGDEQSAYEGYSWSCFFFGAFPALLRGDVKAGLAVLGLCMIAGIGAVMVGLPTWLTTGIIGGVWGFFYNDIHRERLRKAGYEVVTEAAPVADPAQ